MCFTSSFDLYIFKVINKKKNGKCPKHHHNRCSYQFNLPSFSAIFMFHFLFLFSESPCSKITPQMLCDPSFSWSFMNYLHVPKLLYFAVCYELQFLRFQIEVSFAHIVCRGVLHLGILCRSLIIGVLVQEIFFLLKIMLRMHIFLFLKR